MEHAERLAQWIRSNVTDRPDVLTHLKLQKLAFYCYGACLAFELDHEVGEDIAFEAWEHGPVCRALWTSYRKYGGNPIPRPDARVEGYSKSAEKVLKDVLDVYGLLPAWLLRQESHLETPWRLAWAAHRPLTTDELRAHFTEKFRSGPVRLPAYLTNTSSSALDGIPAQNYGSLDRLARVARSLQA